MFCVHRRLSHLLALTLRNNWLLHFRGMVYGPTQRLARPFYCNHSPYIPGAALISPRTRRTLLVLYCDSHTDEEQGGRRA